MGRASRRKRQQGRGRHGDRVQAAGEVLAPNLEGAALDATRYAVAMATAAHASQDDLPRLIEDLSGDEARQGLVAYALVSQLIMDSISALAAARSVTLTTAVDDVIENLQADTPANQPALDRARNTVRKYAEVLDGKHPPETVVADLDTNIAVGHAALDYLTALAYIADRTIVARCAETDEDPSSYLQQVALPAAEAHGNEIDADAAEDYVGALLAARLDTEPALLTHAALALRTGSAVLDEEAADEFRELGGSARLEQLSGASWDDLDAEDQRLVIITLLESILVDVDGGTVADRLSVTWRF